MSANRTSITEVGAFPLCFIEADAKKGIVNINAANSIIIANEKCFTYFGTFGYFKDSEGRFLNNKSSEGDIFSSLFELHFLHESMFIKFINPQDIHFLRIKISETGDIATTLS